MALKSLGIVNVPTPGTIVRATSNQTDPNARFACHAFMIEAKPANLGKVYVGLFGFSKTTGVGLLAVLAVPSANTIPSFSATISYAPAALNLADIYIDADNANEGVVVSAVVG